MNYTKRLEPGDKVILLRPHSSNWVIEMEQYIGRVVTIVGGPLATVDDEGYSGYRIREDGMRYFWRENIMELIFYNPPTTTITIEDYAPDVL